MVRFKNYGIVILLLLYCIFVCYVPGLNAQYANSLISSSQSVFQSGQSTVYVPFFIDLRTQSNSNLYNAQSLGGNAFLSGIAPSTPSGDYMFSQINQNSWSQGVFSNSHYSPPFSMDTQAQSNTIAYYSNTLLKGPPFQGVMFTNAINGYRFSEINQKIGYQDILLNSSWLNHYAYPAFSIPLNPTLFLPLNLHWGYSGFLFPQSKPVDHLLQGYTYFQNGEYTKAIEELKKAIQLPYEKVAKIQGYLLLGMSYQAFGKEYLGEAERYLEMAADLEIYNTKVSLQLAKVYYDQGKFSKAIEEYSRIIEKEPENAEAIKGLGLSYFKANDLTKALKQLQKSELNDPNDLEIIYTMGVLYEAKHLYVEAIKYFNRVINLAPESSWVSQARDHLHDIELIGGASNIEDIDEEIKMLIMTAPEPEDMPNDALVVLLDDTHYQLLPDDTLINTTHKLIKILGESGKKGAEIKLSYDSSYQYLTIDLARLIKPDGTIIGASAEDIQEVTPWGNFPLYGNFKVLIISMPGVTAGSVFEYQVTIEDIPGSKLFEPREIDAGFSLASATPVIKAKIEVSVPADREFNIIFKNMESLEPEIVLDGEMKNYIWRLNDIPKMILQPMMPPLSDIAPVLFITSFSSWKTIADWWRVFEFQAIIPDDAIKSRVAELTKGLSTQKDKATAIFQYVASQIRYVGIEYGKSGIIPHHASETYENQYGDCKNKAILLITMLREAGIPEAYPVLIGTTGSSRAWEDVPLVYTFNHAIAVCSVNNEWIWMDPTIETSAFGEFPATDQDREVLVILDDGYDFMRTPVSEAEKNTDREILNVQVGSDLTALSSSTITSTGINAIYSRSYFKALDQVYRKQHLETIVAARTIGGELIDFTLSNVVNLNEPYKLEFQYTDPYYIEWAGDFGFIKPSYLAPNKAAITEEERIYPVFLGNTSVGESTISITLPENIDVLYLPPPITLEIPEILFISEYTLNNHTITYYLLYEIRELYVPLEEYPAYKTFQEEVARELKRKIIIEMH